MKVAVTGSEGYIGGYVCSLLESSSEHTLHSRIDIKRGESILDLEQLKRSFSEVDAVIHLAASLDTYNCMRDNLEGSYYVGMAAESEGVESVVFASSAAVYNNEHEESPLSRYGHSKLGAEKVLSSFDFDLACLRFFNVCGGDDNGITRLCRQDDKVELYEEGEAIRDFVHVEDVAEAVIKSIGEDKVSDVGTGKGIKIEALENSYDTQFEKVSKEVELVRSVADRNIVEVDYRNVFK